MLNPASFFRLSNSPCSNLFGYLLQRQQRDCLIDLSIILDCFLMFFITVFDREIRTRTVWKPKSKKTMPANMALEALGSHQISSDLYMYS